MARGWLRGVLQDARREVESWPTWMKSGRYEVAQSTTGKKKDRTIVTTKRAARSRDLQSDARNQHTVRRKS